MHILLDLFIVLHNVTMIYERERKIHRYTYETIEFPQYMLSIVGN